MDDRTYVPGMSEDSFSNNPSETFTPNMNYRVGGDLNAQRNMNRQPTLETPVVGFLYSISRKGIGEYWPVYLGSNSIGRSSDNDIQLLEGTISDKHACLSVKRMRSNGRLIASIRDVGSKTGMYLNEEELDYDNHSCKNGDIITIGANYQLLLMLVEVDAYGLKMAEHFIPISEENVVTAPKHIPNPNPANPVSPDFNPYSPRNRKFVQNATVDLNGATNEEFGGNTDFIP